MKLRQAVSFEDDVADAVQEWPDAYTGIDAARRWAAAMELNTPGALAMEPETWCDEHERWEEWHECVACGWPLDCEAEAVTSCDEADETRCEECLEDWRIERAEEYDARPPVQVDQPEVLR